MGLTSKVALTMAASAVGALMIAGGSFAMFTASSSPAHQPVTFAAGTVKLDNTQGLCWTGDIPFNNLEPGDTGTGALTFKNTGTLDEWVSLENLIQGPAQSTINGAPSPDIFATYPNDNNPLGITYTVQLLDSQGQPISGTQFAGNYQTNNKPVNYFSSGSSSTGSLAEGPVQTNTFYLPVGDSAKVTYTWNFPLSAMNDYQNASGTLSINADAIQASNNINSDGTGPNTPPTVSLKSTTPSNS